MDLSPTIGRWLVGTSIAATALVTVLVLAADWPAEWFFAGPLIAGAVTVGVALVLDREDGGLQFGRLRIEGTDVTKPREPAVVDVIRHLDAAYLDLTRDRYESARRSLAAPSRMRSGQRERLREELGDQGVASLFAHIQYLHDRLQEDGPEVQSIVLMELEATLSNLRAEVQQRREHPQPPETP